MKNAYIYTLRDPRNLDEVRYVGVTVDPKPRLNQHLNETAKSGSRSGLWLNALLLEDVEPVLSIVEEVTFEARDEQERSWIALYLDAGHDLTNTQCVGRKNLPTILSLKTCMNIPKPPDTHDEWLQLVQQIIQKNDLDLRNIEYLQKELDVLEAKLAAKQETLRQLSKVIPIATRISGFIDLIDNPFLEQLGPDTVKAAYAHLELAKAQYDILREEYIASQQNRKSLCPVGVNRTQGRITA